MNEEQAMVREHNSSNDNGKSVYRVLYWHWASPLDYKERFLMQQLCQCRGLDTMYYEGSLSLLMRCKPHLTTMHWALQSLACLSLTVKFCGPRSLVPRIQYDKTRGELRQHFSIQPDAKTTVEHELDILQCINWLLF
jgi:hypothetical protein